MTAKFEQDVRDRRDHTPWASLDLKSFGRDMARNGAAADRRIAESEGYDPEQFVSRKNDFTVIIQCVPESRSGFWYVVKWTGADGQRRCEDGEHLHEVLWRAAHIELNTVKRLEREKCEEECVRV